MSGQGRRMCAWRDSFPYVKRFYLKPNYQVALGFRRVSPLSPRPYPHFLRPAPRRPTVALSARGVIRYHYLPRILRIIPLCRGRPDHHLLWPGPGLSRSPSAPCELLGAARSKWESPHQGVITRVGVSITRSLHTV